MIVWLPIPYNMDFRLVSSQGTITGVNPSSSGKTTGKIFWNHVSIFECLELIDADLAGGIPTKRLT